MVVDLTLSSDSEEDNDSLQSIKERINRQRSTGSQSSCPPDSADETATPNSGILNQTLLILFLPNHSFNSTGELEQQRKYDYWW